MLFALALLAFLIGLLGIWEVVGEKTAVKSFLTGIAMIMLLGALKLFVRDTSHLSPWIRLCYVVMAVLSIVVFNAGVCGIWAIFSWLTAIRAFITGAGILLLGSAFGLIQHVGPNRHSSA